MKLTPNELGVVIFVWWQCGTLAWYLLMRDMKRMGQKYLTHGDILRIPLCILIGPSALCFIAAAIYEGKKETRVQL